MYGFGLPELIVLCVIFTPFILWVLALVDIIRSDFSGNNKIIWVVLVILLPLLGAILYYFIGRKQKIDRSLAAAIEGDGAKFCTSCGAEIKARAEICPSCGVRQMLAPGGAANKSIATVLIILVVGLGGVAVVGILAAIAIPQFASYRTKAYDSAALSDLKNVKTGIESYALDHQNAYPDTLDSVKVPLSAGVDLSYSKVDHNGYMVISAHDKGQKSYLSTSDSKQIKWKLKADSDEQYAPL